MEGEEGRGRVKLYKCVMSLVVNTFVRVRRACRLAVPALHQSVSPWSAHEKGGEEETPAQTPAGWDSGFAAPTPGEHLFPASYCANVQLDC